MSFSDEDVAGLKKTLARNFGSQTTTSEFGIEKLKALLARLEAAEKMVEIIGEDVPDAFKNEYEAWCKASGRG